MPARSQRTRSVLTFFANDHASNEMVYANADITKTEQAREIIHDVSYFGTMLVHNDMVDGMVSPLQGGTEPAEGSVMGARGDELYEVGTLAVLVRMLKLGDGSARIMVQGLERARLIFGGRRFSWLVFPACCWRSWRSPCRTRRAECGTTNLERSLMRHRRNSRSRFTRTVRSRATARTC